MDHVSKIVGALLILLQLHGAYGRQLTSTSEVDYYGVFPSESNVMLPAAGVNHVAGGALGWFVSRLEGIPSFYQDWATSSGPFRVGDTIEFRYFADDTILQVDAFGFGSCIATKTVASYTGGSTVVTLNTPGMMYFISKNINNCSVGLKVSINVVAA